MAASAMVSCGALPVKARTTASPRASDVMKFGSEPLPPAPESRTRPALFGFTCSGLRFIVESLGLRWPAEATRVFTVSVADVQAFRDLMLAEGGARTRASPLELEQTLIPRLARMRKLHGMFIPSESWLPVNTPKDMEEAEKVLPRMNPQLASHA